ncbi:hypothetical protein [Hydrogenimonas sp.]
MKFAKLSLAAIMAMGISAFAADVKVDGDVKVFYGTNDADSWTGALLSHPNGIQDNGETDGDLFGKHNSYANAAARIGMTAENMPGDLTGRISVTWLDTFALENSIVNDVWAGEDVGSALWFDEAYLKGTVFDKTTVIAGRQYLDTPMVFSEKWNIVSNSYDAAVVVDQHIEKTALVAAWVWGSNINGAATVATGDGSFNDGFGTFVDNGAYAFGAVTTLIPYTTAQAWYYNVDSIAQAYWLQADIAPEFDTDAKFVLGGQFAGTMAADSLHIPNSEDATVWAVKAGVEFSGLNVSAAYSSADKGDIGFSNVGGAQSKLYTEAWWNYGYVSAPDTDALNVTAEYSWADVADFGAYYTATDSNDRGHDLTEFALTAGKNWGAFDTTLAYVYTDAEDQNDDDSYNTLQVYLTYNF